MNKLNLLSKLAIAGIAGVSATTMFGVGSAQAFEIRLSDAINGGGTVPGPCTRESMNCIAVCSRCS